MAKIPAWLEYQNRVGAFFASLGFEVRVGEKIRGARGLYEIDVTARYSKAGFDQLWIVECKLWANAVPQAQVLTFAAIMDDVGADRGIFVSENGFQAGARSAVVNRSISLVTFEELRQRASHDFDAARADDLSDTLSDLVERIGRIGVRRKSRRGVSRQWRNPESVSVDLMSALGVIATLRDAVHDAKRHGFPVGYFAVPDHGIKWVSTWDELFSETSDLIVLLERIVVEYERENSALDDRGANGCT